MSDKVLSGELVENVISTEIVELKKSTVLQAFTSDDGLKSVVDDARELVDNFEHDMSTKAGRDRTRSFAARFPKLKNKLDGFGIDLVADMKNQCKVIDSSRKEMRDELDELRVIARQPLTDWEAEDARLKAEEVARIEAEKLREKFKDDHGNALTENKLIDLLAANAKAEEERLATVAAAKAEQEAKELAEAQERYRIAEEKQRLKRDARIAAEAAQKAKKEAEAKAQAELDRIAQEGRKALERVAAAKRQAEQAERDKIAAQERATVQAEEAEKRRIEAAEKAKRDAKEAAENARLAEVKRQNDEAARIKSEEIAREQNKQNRLKKHKAAKKDLMEIFGLNDKLATSVVQGISKGLISDVTIKY